MIKLVKSNVVFNEEDHIYMLGDKQLFGITGMLSRQLFPHKYDNIPEFIIKRAAEKGSYIHSQCQFVDVTGFDTTCEEANNYTLLRTQNGFESIGNEYTVTDNEYFASNIDCVWEKDGNVSLADIKTTYHLDKEYVSWQLSIYAHLFEAQNPGLKVEHLFAVWLRGSIAELIEVDRKPDEEVVRLMDCERNGEQYSSSEVVKVEKALMTQSAIDSLVEVTELAAYYKDMEAEMKAKLMAAMKAYGVKSWDAEVFKATYTPPTKAATFDSTRFKAENPELYNQYMKESEKRESIRITLRKK